MDMDLERCLQGDKEGWDAFVRRVAPIIFRAVARVLARHGRIEECEDATQDVFVRLIKDDHRLLRSYDPSRSSLSTWLTVVARSTALDLLRRQRLRTAPLLEDAHPIAEPEDETPRLVLPRGLLSPRQRLVLHFLFDRDLDVPEVAQLLGVDEQTVRSTKHKALTVLRRHFGARDQA